MYKIYYDGGPAFAFHSCWGFLDGDICSPEKGISVWRIRVPLLLDGSLQILVMLIGLEGAWRRFPNTLDVSAAGSMLASR